jgi:DNA repair exonuclease SbcCD ATPase subunit
MKFVTFQQLKIKNFLSVGEEEVIINFSKGLHIITGINKDKIDRRNGVGKSTIADALFFAVFGTTVRDIKKEFVPNNLTSGTCSVELSFNVNSPKGNDDFVVKRTLNPSKLSIIKNGKDKTRDSIANTTEYICAVLSSSPELFHNCVIMTVNNTLPFMAKTKGEKRKFIEQIFNLQVFSDMLSILKEDQNKVNKSFDIENAKLEVIKNTIEQYSKQKEVKTKEKQNKIEALKTKIVKNQFEVIELEKDLKKLDVLDFSSKKENLDKLQKTCKLVEEKIESLVIKTVELKTDLKQKKTKFLQIGTDKDVCPTCLRPIEQKDREDLLNIKKNLENEIKDHEERFNYETNEVNSYKHKLENGKSLISKLEEELSDLKSQIANKTYIIKRIQDLNYINGQLNENINDISADNNPIDDFIKTAKEGYDQISTELENIKKVINLLDAVKFVVSEEGVKSYIVKKILQNFNSKLAFYLKKLDSNSICIFNEYFEEEILNEKGKICCYNNFSGAERKAIDLACLFSFMDMRKAQGNVHYNVSIYDELLDSSLDEKGVEIVLDILKERSIKFNECVMIISHRKESIKSATGDVIFLEKQNGITRRVKFIE